MSASSKNKKTSQSGKMYPTERLLKSRALAGYQGDFARAILTEDKYTAKEAQELLEGVLKRR